MRHGKYTYRHISKVHFDQFEEGLAIAPKHDMKVLARNPVRWTHVIENATYLVDLLARDLGTTIKPYGDQETKEPEVTPEPEPEIIEEETPESDV